MLLVRVVFDFTSGVADCRSLREIRDGLAEGEEERRLVLPTRLSSRSSRSLVSATKSSSSSSDCRDVDLLLRFEDCLLVDWDVLACFW